MPLISVKAGVRVAGLKTLRDGRRQSIQLKQAAALISADMSGFIFKRFQVFSKGGGTWPPIAESTARRKGHRRILYETGDFQAGLRMGLNQRISWNGPWLNLTYSMRARRKHKPSGLPIQRLLEIHQNGLGRMPKRPVIVPPSNETKRKILQRLQKAVRARSR